MRITRRQFSAASLAAAAQPRRASAARRPNIVVILADDLGYADLGFQGCRDIPTPHLDSLARTGVRFTSGYVSHPFCSPTRAGLMTGRYQQRFGHENNMKFKLNDEVAGLPLSEVTLPQVLSGAGYVTGLVGKWHLGVHPKFHPLKRGFREMYGFLGGGHDYLHPGAEGEQREHFLPILRNGDPVDEKEYLTTAMGREAAAFVRRHQRVPFFLYLSFNAPHTPLQAPDAYVNRFSKIAHKDRRVYAAMVSAMDDAVGQVLAALRQAQLEEETLVFFLSDNGGPSGNASDNRPLRGTKRTLYDGGIRVPFVIRWPGRLPQGKTMRHPVISLDVFPTALAAAEVQAPKDRQWDGVNLLPVLDARGGQPPERNLFWRTFGGVHFAARNGPLKLVRNADAQAELYDVERDPGESRNLAGSRPADVARLEEALNAWNRELVTPLWPDHIFHRPA
jgi:arylsulfatase A-like enzyme